MVVDARAIITVTIGDEYEDLSEITHPFMQRYAKKVGADFIVIRQREFERFPIFYEKFQLPWFLQTYKRVAFIDTDVLVSPQTPDLFEEVPEGHFGALCESCTKTSQAPDDYFLDLLKICRVSWNGHYANSGVMVAEDEMSDLFGWPMFINDFFGDQTQLNLMLSSLKTKFHEFGPEFNRVIPIMGGAPDPWYVVGELLDKSQTWMYHVIRGLHTTRKKLLEHIAMGVGK